MWQYHYSNPDEYIEHHGILGMKWGVRRYQNDDGSLTKAGRRRYGSESAKSYKRRLNDLDEEISLHEIRYNAAHKKEIKYSNKAANYSEKNNANEKKLNALKSKAKEQSLISKYHIAKQKTYTNDTNKIIKEALNKNFNVNGMRTTRLVNISSNQEQFGKKKAVSKITGMSLYGIGGIAGTAYGVKYLSGLRPVQGRKYTVTKNKYYSHMNGTPKGNVYLEK